MTANDPSSSEPIQFYAGHVLLSEGIKQDFDNGLLVDFLLDRHVRGDWGDVSDYVRALNVTALAIGHPDRILSLYHPSGAFGPIVVVTELGYEEPVTLVMRISDYLSESTQNPSLLPPLQQSPADIANN